MIPDNYLELLKAAIPYLLIPVFNAIIGWFTNWLALKMTFYPLEFRGIPPYMGWQGIIPSKAASMARKSVDMLTEKLLNVVELFDRMDPTRVAKEMDAEVRDVSRRVIDEVMMAQAPLVWKAMPRQGKDMVYNKIAERLPHVITEMMSDIKHQIDDLFDVKTMVVEILVKNKSLLNSIFEECGKKEFKFIEISGFYFGFLFGAIQAWIWYYFQHWSLLIIFGVVVGYATNDLALRFIFWPQNPIKVGPFTFQGLFMKRQAEVAAVYARVVAQNILTMPNIFDNIVRSHTSPKLNAIVRHHINLAVDDAVGTSKPLLEALAGHKIEVAKNIAAYRFMEEMPIMVRHIFDYAGSALDIENTLREKMVVLSPLEFEGFLHPVFQEDEMKLIIVGAILGGIAGALQLFMF